MTTIDFSECEAILIKKYEILNNKSIYLIKIDVEQEGMRILKIEYDAYCKLIFYKFG